MTYTCPGPNCPPRGACSDCVLTPRPERPVCNLSVCPEGDGDHRVGDGRCLLVMSAPSEPPAAAQEAPHVCGVPVCGDPWCSATPPADAPEQQDDEHAHPALRDALCRYLDDRADYADRGNLADDLAELWEYVAPALASRRPAEADQQRRELVARWAWALLGLGPWRDRTLGAARAYAAADELLSLLSAHAGPADQDGEQ